MKVGDLVTMPPGANQMYRTGYDPDPDTQVVGIVVETALVSPNGEEAQNPRVAILWSDGEGVDWEPEAWLEVISERSVKVGDLVKWTWHLGTDWAQTHFMGIVIGTRTYNPYGSCGEVIVFQVLDNSGQVIQVREDEQSLKLIA